MGLLKRKHLDLFSGIGGFALAARWAGFETIGFCEIDKYCRKVLKKNFPGVPIYEDVTKLNGSQFKDIFLITGGFPCQDISIAGKGAGIDGERSGLWSELFRIIGEVRPKYALIENVPALTFRGGTRVIGDLTEIGYDCEWQIVGADDVGAPHRRKRIWIVAYTNSKSESNGSQYEQWMETENVANSQYSTDRTNGGQEREEESIQGVNRQEGCGGLPGGTGGNSRDVAHSSKQGLQGTEWQKCEGERERFTECSKDVAYSNPGLSERKNQEICTGGNSPDNGSEDVAHSKSKRVEGCGTGGEQESHTYAQEGLSMCEGERSRATEGSIGTSIRGMVDGIPEGLHKDVMWQKEPEDINRVSMGVKNRTQRLKGLGNSICPQVAYEIMRCLK